MFSSISNYIWGSSGNDTPAAGGNDSLPPPTANVEDELSNMEISSIISSDEEMKPFSDNEDDWVLIAEDEQEGVTKSKTNRRKVKDVKQERMSKQPKYAVTKSCPVNKDFSVSLSSTLDERPYKVSYKPFADSRVRDAHKELFNRLRPSQQLLGQMDEVKEDHRHVVADSQLRKVTNLAAEQKACFKKLQSFAEKEPARRPRNSHKRTKIISSNKNDSEVVRPVDKTFEDADVLQSKIDRQAELALLMADLKPTQKSEKIREHGKLSRKALTKHNAVRAVASAGKGRLRRSDRLKPTLCARSNNNRKIH